MAFTYAYRGDDVVDGYLMRCLPAKDWQRTADVKQAQCVITHCYHLGALEDAYFEDDGLIKQAAPGTLLMDLSASTPSLSRELSAVAAVNDLRFVEAPLAPKDPFAPEAWTDPVGMACYVSGEKDHRAEVLPIAHLLADSVYETGGCGNASLAKAMHTVRQAADAVSAIEAQALFHGLGERGYNEGSDPLLDISFGRSFSECSQLLRAREFTGSFTVALFMSDVAAAMAAADDGELILPQLEAALHILELVGVIGGADKGVATLGLLYRDEAEGAEAGLDWGRAEGLYAEGYGEEGYGSHSAPTDEGFGFPDGFGGYSAN